MAEFKLEIITLDKVFYKGDIQALTVKGIDGDFEILPRHSDLIAVLLPDDIKIMTKDGERHAFISKGILRIRDNDAAIIVNTAEWPEDIDLERAIEAEKRARERLKAKSSARMDIVKVELALMRALARKKTFKYRKI